MEAAIMWLDHRLGNVSRWLCRRFKYPAITYTGLTVVAIILVTIGSTQTIAWLKISGVCLFGVCVLAMLNFGVGPD